ncbi:hypothetical protein C0J52_14333 [Blattella germanica]|nr:hypothetical protein C0J52_14333 [Blattella germanica]
MMMSHSTELMLQLTTWKKKGSTILHTFLILLHVTLDSFHFSISSCRGGSLQ